jgi:GT2 family glycosyltransferase
VADAIDVVVVRFGDATGLRECLLAAQEVPGVGPTIVVDHGGGALPDLPGSVEVVTEENRGFGAGVNRGVGLGRAALVLMVNPDAVVDPDAVSKGASLLGRRPEIAAVQGVIRNSATGEPERWRGIELRAWHLWGRALGLRRLLRLGPVSAVARRIPQTADHAARLPASVEDVEWLAATALLVRRSAFEEIDGFDERYFMYGEDLDLCRRLRAAGWRLCALPVEWARHAGGRSSADEFERELQWWRGTLRFARTWWPRGRVLSADAAAGVRWIRLASRRPRRAGEAWRGLFGRAG